MGLAQEESVFNVRSVVDPQHDATWSSESPTYPLAGAHEGEGTAPPSEVELDKR